MLLELTTDYAHTFGKSNINLMGGYSYQNNVFEGFYMTNWDFPTDFYSYNRMQSGDALTGGEAAMNSSKSENTLIAFFAREVTILMTSIFSWQVSGRKVHRSSVPTTSGVPSPQFRQDGV